MITQTTIDQRPYQLSDANSRWWASPIALKFVLKMTYPL